MIKNIDINNKGSKHEKEWDDLINNFSRGFLEITDQLVSRNDYVF